MMWSTIWIQLWKIIGGINSQMEEIHTFHLQFVRGCKLWLQMTDLGLQLKETELYIIWATLEFHLLNAQQMLEDIGIITPNQAERLSLNVMQCQVVGQPFPAKIMVHMFSLLKKMQIQTLELYK